MASRQIVVKYGDEETSFAFARVDRAKLYGRKERVILDENNERCVPAYLTADGAALVPPGGTAHVYVDEEFDTVERSALRAVDESGNPLTPIESTLGVSQSLTPVRADRILDHLVSSVYELRSDEVGPALKKALEDGELFECAYCYREGYEADALFLLANEEGIFALVGSPTKFDFIQRQAPALDVVPDESDELSEDLDFGMM